MERSNVFIVTGDRAKIWIPSLGFLANFGLKVCTQRKVTGMILAIQNNIEMSLYYLLKRTNINKTNCDSLYTQGFRVSNHFSLNKAFQ